MRAMGTTAQENPGYAATRTGVTLRATLGTSS
jgi:hypothetical protein